MRWRETQHDWLFTTSEHVTQRKEAVYHCWQTVDLSHSTFTNPTPQATQSTNLAEIGFPTDLYIPDKLNYDAFNEYLRVIEQMPDPTGDLEAYKLMLFYRMLHAVDHSVARVADLATQKGQYEGYDIEKVGKAILEMREKNDIRNMYRTDVPFPVVDHRETWQYKSALHFMNAFNPDKDKSYADVARDMKAALMPFLPDDTEEKYALGLLETQDLNSERGFGLHPQAALWHDMWFDPAFNKRALPGKLHVGNVPYGSGWGGEGSDAGAEESLFGYAQSNIDYTLYREADERNQPISLLYPPNLTNLHIVHLPRHALFGRDETLTTEQKMFASKRATHVAVVFCPTPERLNPVEFTRGMNEAYTEGGWTLVTNTTDGLRSLQPLPRSQWVIKSRLHNQVELGSQYSTY